MRILLTQYLSVVFITGHLSADSATFSSLPQSIVIQSAEEALLALENDNWNYTIQTSPEFATFIGEKGEHGKWSDFDIVSMKENAKASTEFKTRLAEISRDQLSKTKQLHYDILEWLLTLNEEKNDFPFYYLNIDQMNGVHTDISFFLQILSENSIEGYQSLLSRMQAVPKLINQKIALLKMGIKEGIVMPKIVMRSVPEQIISQVTENVEDSVFFTPFCSTADEGLRQKAKDYIQAYVYPSYRQLYQFIVEEYIPACRETTAFSDLPNGSYAYACLVKEHTTTNLSPFEIHQIGLKEVSRIRSEMYSLMQHVGFAGTISEFSEYIQNDPIHFYTSKEELLQGYRDLLSKIESQLPQLFNKLPTLPCEIVPVPEYTEAASVIAYYFPGSIETGRPGQYFVNTFSLKDHPKFNMEALTLHEALPGHHFQITLSQMTELPNVFKHSWTTAFVEGWGLYAEGLGSELGLYTDAYSCFGRLSYEMMRAVRLVVDTGLHAFGWSRQKAIDYCKENLPIDEHEIINEIDRYIVMPGQALAYKIGEQKILEWRKKSKEKEGDAFDIRKFHDELLELGGCLPLEVLDRYFGF